MFNMRPRSDYRFRSRDLALTAKDEAMFSEALREEFPHIGFVSDVGELVFKPNLLEFKNGCAILLPPDADWWAEVESHPWITNHASLKHCSRPYTWISFHRSRWCWSAGYGHHDWAWDPPTLEAGFLSTSFLKDGPPSVERDIRKIWKVAERVAGRCLVPAQLPEDPLPAGPRPRVLPGTSTLLAGFDAAAWCRVAARRISRGWRRSTARCSRTPNPSRESAARSTSYPRNRSFFGS